MALDIPGVEAARDRLKVRISQCENDIAEIVQQIVVQVEDHRFHAITLLAHTAQGLKEQKLSLEVLLEAAERQLEDAR